MIGPSASEAVPAIIEIAKNDKVERVRSIALHTLGYIGPRANSAIPVLLATLNDKTPGVRFNALDSLSLMRLADKAALPALDAAINARGSGTGIEAVELRWRVDGDTPKAVATFAKMLHDKGLRQVVLGRLNRHPEFTDLTNKALVNIYQSAMDDLADCLTDKSSQTRQYAAVALGRLGKSAKPALPALMTALAEQEITVRLAAADAVAEIGGDGRVVVEAIRQDLQAANDQHAARAHEVVRKFGSQAKPVADILRSQLGDMRVERRLLAAETLCAIDPTLREVGIHALFDILVATPSLRPQAALALCKWDGVKQALRGCSGSMPERFTMGNPPQRSLASEPIG